MATLTIRDLPEPTRRALKARAAEHNRSMEAEVRDILQSAVRESDFVRDWLHAASRLGVDLELPGRTPPRPIDLA